VMMVMVVVVMMMMMTAPSPAGEPSHLALMGKSFHLLGL
jgi:hypothetical protein